jgi:two-component system chemotaxis sensor kinase CheA
MMDSHREAYMEEASDLLRELEMALLELEEAPENAELIGRVFRALHTIKGSGAMFGFDDVAAFTHELETVFDGVRDGRHRITAGLIGITLDARDHIRELLHASPGDLELAAVSGQQLERLRQVIAAGGAAPQGNEGQGPLAEPAAFRIRFDPHPDILLSGTNPILLFRELTQLGDLSLSAHRERIPELAELDPDRCYTYWDATLTTTAGEDAIRDVFIFVDDRARLQVERIGQANGHETQRVGDTFVDRGDVDAGEGLPRPDRPDAAAIEQHVDRVRAGREKTEAAATLRIPAAKLDALVNIVGELVTVQARLSAFAVASGEPEINSIAEEVERLTALLRESTMSARMLPIGDTFGRFRRLVRDLAADLGKKIELTTEGNDTELDKTVIEQLKDPLVHLIRNAVDHGIERPEKRAANGKPEAGAIHLAACHSGAFVVISVRDDGAGMDREAIRARAIGRGLIPADAVLTEEEIFALTIAPGFSTADRVTAVSGRGVGMDVVQRSINALRGSLSISSAAGRGTVVTLKIPLTLAIIDGLLVEAGGAFFVVPLANICECIELERRVERSVRHTLVNVRGEWVPYLTLRQRFSLPGEPPEIEHVIVAETRGGKCGFVVDRVIGDHNTVIKKLGGLYREVEEVSGATILGDGTVALILDVDKIAAEALGESRAVESAAA